jgi:hypothetical protein
MRIMGNKRISYSQREEVQGGRKGGKRDVYCDSEGGTTAPTTLNKQYCANYIEKYQKPINAEIHQRSIKSKQELQVTDPQQINSDRSGSEHATLEGLVLCGARTRQRQRAATVC